MRNNNVEEEELQLLGKRKFSEMETKSERFWKSFIVVVCKKNDDAAYNQKHDLFLLNRK